MEAYSGVGAYLSSSGSEVGAYLSSSGSEVGAYLGGGLIREWGLNQSFTVSAMLKFASQKSSATAAYKDCGIAWFLCFWKIYHLFSTKNILL